MKPSPAEAKVNTPAVQSKSGHAAPAGPSGPGPETKADMSGAGLGGAVRELNAQHPVPYHDHGPHHGRSDHIRHVPMRLK